MGGSDRLFRKTQGGLGIVWGGMRKQENEEKGETREKESRGIERIKGDGRRRVGGDEG